MIGVFDSGVGGLAAFTELRRLLPAADLIYLADRSNAPYGTKSRKELVALVQNDVHRLRQMGSERILIACCTASTVWDELSTEEQSITTPIIYPAARRVAELTKGRVTVIATKHTVASHAFGIAIGAAIKNASIGEQENRHYFKEQPTRVTEIATQELVSLVERGERDGRLSRDGELALDRVSRLIWDSDADTLVLGCTHFSHLEGELSARLPGVITVSPAREGARAMAEGIRKQDARLSAGNGRTVYT